MRPAVMVESMPSPAAGLLQYARLLSGLSQAELAKRAGAPRSMVSAYERDERQATLPTLAKLLKAAGFELRMHIEPYDDHDDVLAAAEEHRSPAERQVWRDYQDARVRRDAATLREDLAAAGSRRRS